MMSADASFTRLSPSSTATTRRGTGSLETIAAAATASGGETIAPSAMAAAHGSPGNSACAATATTTDVTSTRPTASRVIDARFALNSRGDVKKAAAHNAAGRNTKNTRSGSSSGISTPGTRPTSNPAATWSTGVGTGSRRPSAVSATTSAANAMPMTTFESSGIDYATRSL